MRIAGAASCASMRLGARMHGPVLPLTFDFDLKALDKMFGVLGLGL
jgi:hypothetical protein